MADNTTQGEQAHWARVQGNLQHEQKTGAGAGKKSPVGKIPPKAAPKGRRGK